VWQPCELGCSCRSTPVLKKHHQYGGHQQNGPNEPPQAHAHPRPEVLFAIGKPVADGPDNDHAPESAGVVEDIGARSPVCGARRTR